MRFKLAKLIRLVPLPLRYGALLALLLILLKLLEYQLFSYRFKQEIIFALLATLFLIVGLSAGFLWFRLTEQHKHKQAALLLTDKEKALLKGLSEGLSYQQLADKHFVSINTVKTQLKKLYKKMSVNNKLEAIAEAKKLTLLPEK